MLRSHHTGLISRSNRLLPAGIAACLSLGGCTMSIPMLGAEDAPATTGSIAGPVEVQKPLPESLAYSDATKIGQAAAVTLWQAEGGQDTEWVNAATGSSGTIEKGDRPDASKHADACGLFNTVVTSIGGVHRYSGRICRVDNGKSVVEIAAPGDARSS